jgi:hypothetical protein
LTEDWFFKHLDEIERIKANLGSRNPSLKQQAAYYRERAEDTSLSREQRDLWDILATGLERRLGLSQAQEQEMLFQMP